MNTESPGRKRQEGIPDRQTFTVIVRDFNEEVERGKGYSTRN